MSRTPIVAGDPQTVRAGTPRATPHPAAPAFPFLLPPEEPGELGRLGSYRVLRLLGEGGMGMVFAAEDTGLLRPTALKVMKPGAAGDDDLGWKRFLREARLMASIKHDHLVTVYQVGQQGLTVFLAMELLAGETLDARLRRPDRPDLAEVLRVGREVATGLAVIHANGLIHRDIKPANLWLEEPDGRVKILDFGLARDKYDDTSLTQSGAVVGTPAYLSPEQARGKPVDARSDLFALGCVLYQLCAGVGPFQAENSLGLIVAVAADDPVPIREAAPGVPEPLAALIDRLLAKNPADRPDSAAAVADELRRIEASQAAPDGGLWEQVTVTPPPAAPVRLPRRPAGRRWGVWPLVGACVVAGAAVGVVLATRGGKPRATEAKPPVAEKANPTPAKAAAPAATSAKVFLTDLTVVGSANWPFKPDPELPLPPGHETFDKVTVKGVRSPHGLFMHASPPFLPPTSASFDLGGKYRTFAAEVGLNDTSDGAQEPMTFSLYGDGTRLWTSDPIRQPGDAGRCSVDVTGVKALKLQVTVLGDPRGAHGAWVEPHVLK